ncbi:MAG: hypothetical protein JXR63_05925, partial [Spirochaetales bacterium]|nr:hypothetical protein [Spirochaetales bacterium]
LSSSKAYDILIKEGYIEEGQVYLDDLELVPSEIFYTIFCRGGLQAVIWLADTLVSDETEVVESIFSWKKEFLPLF